MTIHPRPSWSDDPHAMHEHEGSNKCTPSTPSEWRWAKIRRRPQGSSNAAPQASSLRGLATRDGREPLTVTMRYLGGQECWIELRARGRTVKRPGHLALVDVLEELLARPDSSD